MSLEATSTHKRRTESLFLTTEKSVVRKQHIFRGFPIEVCPESSF